jgi:hypothetical protein
MKYHKVDKINKCYSLIIELYCKLNRAPTTKEYDDEARLRGFLQRRNLESNVGKKWSEICLLLVGQTNQQQYTKEEFHSRLTEIKNKLNRTPMASELKHHGLNFKQCYRLFGKTYNEVIKDIGWKIESKTWKNKNVEEMLDDFKKLYLTLDRIPSMEDIDNCEYMVSYGTYNAKIGNIADICKLCDINIKDNIIINQNRNINNFYINKNKELCLSHPELMISNYLIDSKLEYIKEYPYNLVVQGDNSRRRFDWYIPHHNIFIEYFGLFNEKQVSNNNKIGEYSKKVIKKKRDCRINNIILIDLYRSDLENNLQGVKNKLAPYLSIA